MQDVEEKPDSDAFDHLLHMYTARHVAFGETVSAGVWSAQRGRRL